MSMKLGISGRIASYFQGAQITPLLAIAILLLGLFAILITPREEEPQINVTMANVLIPFPGAAVKNVEQMVSIPAEQVLSQIAGIEHVMSVSQAGLSVITVQFKVGIPRTEALVRLHDTVAANSDWLPKGMGVLEPIIKPKGIDDVPILALTLYSNNLAISAFELEKVANRIESDLKRVKGTREVNTIGGPRRAINVEIDPNKMANRGVTLGDVRAALSSANLGMPVGNLLNANSTIAIESGPYLKDANDVGSIVLGVRTGNPVFLKDIAQLTDGPLQTQRLVYNSIQNEKTGKFEEHPSVTIAITKKPGENAIDVADQVKEQVELLKGAIIPKDVEVLVSRNYGETANDKATKLIQKLLFATLSVVVLVMIALGRREAAIVGSAVVLTLAGTLFASWAWGFTINRVSLFALIFSIGILVDDAIVVVENIHRHRVMFPEKSLKEIIPGAVDEVGSPTILATFTVIAALLPMAFVSGLMGPYMSPIPINASMGMLLSLAIAFAITPWMSRIWLPRENVHTHSGFNFSKWLTPKFQIIFTPLLSEQNGKRNRRRLGMGVLGAIIISIALPLTGLVVLKMLPFDNKSEFQVILDMPADSRVEQTAVVLKEMGTAIAKMPEVSSYQIYAGTAAPINFNGLVRQYYFRQDPSKGDIQVNLVDKHHRSDKSHVIAARIRPTLDTIAKKYGANTKVVEVPPGPPVLAPIVAEVYGPSEEARLTVAKGVRNIFEHTPGLVDVDDSSISSAPKELLLVDRQKANLMGVSQIDIIATLRAGLSGENVTYLQDKSKYPASITIRLPEVKQGDINNLLKLTVRNANRELVPLSKLLIVVDTQREQPIFHKDLLALNYVIADTSGSIDSPLYGLFKTRAEVDELKDASGNSIKEFFISQPKDPYRNVSIKWDGESQITYETFRDMGLAYAVGLILIYLLVVAQFGSYLTPLIIMAPIPLTIIGVMPGHALLGAQFTATSMIGMIALAGIIVRNSILLVDFINLQVRSGIEFKQAVVNSAITRAQPIVLTGLAAMLGAFFILDDPIFNGLAISLIFGILVSTVLTLVVIPLLYYSAYANKLYKIFHTNN
ncbi:efflux RND transporter permease subunit [Polynucleobacter sphagniphilus]|uniref:efflux RND transporter permease subunit n=1 Tax=Polynucleobacter sphagniphilus TaxID=1743169 RepID=UPI00096B765F|nr:efflux RND transporter permease subunit [Polynucleobacter sphagniphilus]MDF9789181.1 multidrug efflux pump subunit AcrB [Polynucleobacter sphagniphilus]OLY95560.1 multidrug transporter AcrB [Polynucleobacter sphagniphilus]